MKTKILIPVLLFIIAILGAYILTQKPETKYVCRGGVVVPESSWCPEEKGKFIDEETYQLCDSYCCFIEALQDLRSAPFPGFGLSFKLGNLTYIRCKKGYPYSQFEARGYDNEGNEFYVHSLSGGAAASGSDSISDRCLIINGEKKISKRIAGRDGIKSEATCHWVTDMGIKEWDPKITCVLNYSSHPIAEVKKTTTIKEDTTTTFLRNNARGFGRIKVLEPSIHYSQGTLEFTLGNFAGQKIENLQITLEGSGCQEIHEVVPSSVKAGKTFLLTATCDDISVGNSFSVNVTVGYDIRIAGTRVSYEEKGKITGRAE